jgi:hypothetical protein
VTRAPFTGTYTVNPDASTTIDICLTLPATFVRLIWQGAFSSSFRALRFIGTQFSGSSNPPSSGCDQPLVQLPNVTSGTAEKL